MTENDKTMKELNKQLLWYSKRQQDIEEEIKRLHNGYADMDTIAKLNDLHEEHLLIDRRIKQIVHEASQSYMKMLREKTWS